MEQATTLIEVQAAERKRKEFVLLNEIRLVQAVLMLTHPEEAAEGRIACAFFSEMLASKQTLKWWDVNLDSYLEA